MILSHTRIRLPRFVRCSPLFVAVVLCACSDSTSNGHGIPDLDGLANFIVDSARIASSWTIGSDNVEAGSCTSIEYGISPGFHRVLRFTVSTPNIGDADGVVGDPLEHVDPNHDGNFNDSDGLFEYAPCHNHFHYKHYATYELLQVLPGGGLGAPIFARKRGFCMDDSEPNPGVDPKSWVYRECGTLTRHGNQGVHAGWADVYVRTLPGQYFVLDDSTQPTPPGEYVIRVTVNPPYIPDSTDACPVHDEQGFCRVLRESNYTDNVALLHITLPPP
jgi:hypothetical protein